MRTAAVTSAAIVAIGLYLAVATLLSISISWIALGILAIAVVSAMGVMAGERSSARSVPR